MNFSPYLHELVASFTRIAHLMYIDLLFQLRVLKHTDGFLAGAIQVLFLSSTMVNWLLFYHQSTSIAISPQCTVNLHKIKRKS